MKISELKQDSRNANRGTARGNKSVEASLSLYGAGRSILIDRNGHVIAGNSTSRNAAAAGIDELIIVPSDGSKLIAVQRTDIDLDSPEGRALAIADNRTSELGLEWNPEILAEFATDLDLKPFFHAAELTEITYPDIDKANDVEAEYTGMPEYSSEDKMGARSLIVHFTELSDVEEFSRLIGQSFSAKAKFIWFPPVPNADLASYKFTDTNEHDTTEIPDIHTDAE